MNQSNKVYNAALYLRLSREDEREGESSSIQSQRDKLRKYAVDNGFIVYDEYTDDGFSGTNFDRPNFQRMKEDIMRGHINCVITKDLSRLGRDTAGVMELIGNFFPENNVRYIAIDDNYDSENINSGMQISTQFMVVVNSVYAMDISRKIRSSLHSRMSAGKFVAPFPHYGYMRDPNDSGHLIPDHEAAEVVQMIFQMAADNVSPGEIAKALNAQGIMTPAEYRCKVRPYLNIDNYSTRKEWTSQMICKMLKNEVYIGNLCQGRSQTIGSRKKKVRYLPKDEWKISYGTHEPLISQDVFELVHKRSVSRRNPPTKGFHSIFTGIAKCADCGRAMSPTGTRKKGDMYNLCCGAYKQHGASECSNHFISYNTLCEVVLCELRKWLVLTEDERNQIVEELRNKETKRVQTFALSNADKLRQCKREKKNALDYLTKAHEEYTNGTIIKMVYDHMMHDYSARLTELEEDIQRLTALLETDNSQSEAYQKFFSLLDDITDLKELTHDILVKLIDRIEVEQGVWIKDENGKKIHKQEIHIYYKFIGCIDEE